MVGRSGVCCNAVDCLVHFVDEGWIGLDFLQVLSKFLLERLFPLVPGCAGDEVMVCFLVAATWAFLADVFYFLQSVVGGQPIYYPSGSKPV